MRYLFAGIGACGTLTGIGKYLKEKDPSVQIIAIEPNKGHRLPGMKNLTESKEPGIQEPLVMNRIIRVDDDAAYSMTKAALPRRRFDRGTVYPAQSLHCAAEFAREEQSLAVAISPDSGFKYASYFTDILGDEGLPAQ